MKVVSMLQKSGTPTNPARWNAEESVRLNLIEQRFLINVEQIRNEVAVWKPVRSKSGKLGGRFGPQRLSTADPALVGQVLLCPESGDERMTVR